MTWKGVNWFGVRTCKLTAAKAKNKEEERA